MHIHFIADQYFDDTGTSILIDFSQPVFNIFKTIFIGQVKHNQGSDGSNNYYPLK